MMMLRLLVYDCYALLNPGFYDSDIDFAQLVIRHNMTRHGHNPY